MSLWGVTPLLAAALLGSGGAHMAVDHHTIELSATQSRSIQNFGKQGAADIRTSPKPTLSTSPSPSPSSTSSLSPPTGAGAVLRQVGSQGWTTTVLLNDNKSACMGKPFYWLFTTSPDRIIGPAPATVTPIANPGTGSSCEVTVGFTGLRQVPETAALVINQPGGSSAIPLSVSRDVTLYYYLVIPVAVGVLMALVGFLISKYRVQLYDKAGRLLPRSGTDFWEHPIAGSGAWALNDSWATNITTGLVVVGTILTTTTAANSLFPGVALDRFAIVNVVVGGIVVAAPIVFGILYARWTGKHPGVPADATLRLPSDGGDPPVAPAAITVPAGASIVTSGTATVRWQHGQIEDRVCTDKAIAIPPGSRIRVRSDARAFMTLPGTTSDIAVYPGSELRIDRSPGNVPGPGELPIPRSDLLHAPRNDPHISYPATITAPGGAKITLVGVADITLPRGTDIVTPNGQPIASLQMERELQEPQGSNTLIASLRIILIAAVVTMFGMGAELGIAGVLAYGLSDATQSWRLAMLGGVVLVGMLVLWYSATAISALAGPQPGSSLSAAPGTSFTL